MSRENIYTRIKCEGVCPICSLNGDHEGSPAYERYDGNVLCEAGRHTNYIIDPQIQALCKSLVAVNFKVKSSRSGDILGARGNQILPENIPTLVGLKGSSFEEISISYSMNDLKWPTNSDFGSDYNREELDFPVPDSIDQAALVLAKDGFRLTHAGGDDRLSLVFVKGAGIAMGITARASWPPLLH